MDECELEMYQCEIYNYITYVESRAPLIRLEVYYDIYTMI